jgi:hypothetical protein
LSPKSVDLRTPIRAKVRTREIPHYELRTLRTEDLSG